jgi:hypothetical protein
MSRSSALAIPLTVLVIYLKRREQCAEKRKGIAMWKRFAVAPMAFALKTLLWKKGKSAGQLKAFVMKKSVAMEFQSNVLKIRKRHQGQCAASAALLIAMRTRRATASTTIALNLPLLLLRAAPTTKGYVNPLGSVPFMSRRTLLTNGMSVLMTRSAMITTRAPLISVTLT